MFFKTLIFGVLTLTADHFYDVDGVTQFCRTAVLSTTAAVGFVYRNGNKELCCMTLVVITSTIDVFLCCGM